MHSISSHRAICSRNPLPRQPTPDPGTVWAKTAWMLLYCTAYPSRPPGLLEISLQLPSERPSYTEPQPRNQVPGCFLPNTNLHFSSCATEEAFEPS
jgi:hypothetical protein